MKILLDMDSIIVDLPTTWYGVHNETHGCSLSNDTVKSWDIHKWCTCGKGEAVYQHLLEKDFFITCKPMKNAISVISNLSIKHEIHFVTSAPLGSPWPVHEKWNWLKSYLPSIVTEHNFWITKSKGMINADVLFDDYPANFKEFKGICITLDYPYNRDWTGLRVHNWLEFQSIIQHLHEGRMSSIKLDKPKYAETSPYQVHGEASVLRPLAGEVYYVKPANNSLPGGPSI